MKKTSILAGFLILFATAAFLFLRIQRRETPEENLKNAQKMISQARELRSHEYAEPVYRAACTYFDSAMLEWKKENERSPLFRDYHKTILFARKAGSLAGEAIRLTRVKIPGAEDQSARMILDVEERIGDFYLKFGRFPLSASERVNLARSSMLLNEGKSAFEKKKFHECLSLLGQSLALIGTLRADCENKLETYFNRYPQWKELVSKNIAYSEKHKCCIIIVDKIARQCLLYKNGKLIRQFDSELGVNWLGDKMRQGDKATPEGFYRITMKKTAGATKYYRALVLDYPNMDDKKRFEHNKRKGLVKPGEGIGNAIEIHGGGGRGLDWTDGCIALKDEDMGALYSFCVPGTPVIIIGSTRNLNDIFSSPL